MSRRRDVLRTARRRATAQRNTLYDGLFRVPTFAEVLDLRARLSRDLGRRIGVYPETKHPTYLRAAAGGAPGHSVRSSEQCSVQATAM